MNNTQITQKQADEKEVRRLFNNKFQASLINKETRLQISQFACHKFDIYEQGKFIGGITTSTWTVGNKSQNTGGKDRISAELLWLSLWPGKERRFMVITDKEMAFKMYKIWQGCPFSHMIEILYCDLGKKVFTSAGMLG